MMKSAVIINDHAFVNGGQAKVAIETALMLAKAGLRVIFFAGVGPEDKRLAAAGVHSICLNQYDLVSNPDRKQAALLGLWNRTASRELAAALHSLEPRRSIVHVHGWAKSLSPSIGPIVSKSNIPHVYTLHEYFLACPNGGFYDRQHQEICTRRPLGASCLMTHCDQRRRSHKAWRVMRQAVLWSAGTMPRSLRDFIYLSETQFRAMRHHLPADARMHYLPNSVDGPPATRVEAERNELFLFVGRLSPEKGPELVAKAAREANVRIAFAGEGECRDAIIAANPQAQMLGWQSAQELNETMSRARCVVFPSLWYEGYPMVVVEAMRLGLPILASDRTAAAEVVRHRQDGLHVRTGDRNAWIEAMRQMADDREISQYSASSFKRAIGFLDPSAYRDRLLEIYDDASKAQRSERRINA